MASPVGQAMSFFRDQRRVAEKPAGVQRCRIDARNVQQRQGLGHVRHVHESVVHRDAPEVRSEEHTSELQSPCNPVCRLLLEKKNAMTRPSSCAAVSVGAKPSLARPRPDICAGTHPAATGKRTRSMWHMPYPAQVQSTSVCTT